MKVVGLSDNRLVARHPMKFGLSDETGLQEQLDRAVNRREADSVTLFQQVIPDFLDRWMSLRFEKRSPDQRALGRLLKFLFCKEFNELFALCHRRDYTL